jgi:hypothetical protein
MPKYRAFTLTGTKDKRRSTLPMTIRVIMAAALGAALGGLAGPASAADMPGSYAPPPEPVVSLDCTLHAGHRPADKVYLPPRVAYIVAERCGKSQYWLNTLMSAPRHEEILVYYNGGSMNRTDVTMLRVPPSYRRPH